jgi:hypothetical protein
MNPRTPVFTGESPAQTSPSLTLNKGVVGNCRPFGLPNVGKVLPAPMAVPQGNEGAAILRQQHPEAVGDKAHSVTLLTESDLARLSDEDLQRYIRRIADRMQAAHAAWKAADSAWAAFGCEDDRQIAEISKLAACTLWTAEQKALKARHQRPELVGRLERERGLA